MNTIIEQSNIINLFYKPASTINPIGPYCPIQFNIKYKFKRNQHNNKKVGIGTIKKNIYTSCESKNYFLNSTVKA